MLSNESPYEIIFSQKPTYSNLRVFGCLWYANTLFAQRSKFDPRDRNVVFQVAHLELKDTNCMICSQNLCFYKGM